jgi:hypothetical protein
VELRGEYVNTFFNPVACCFLYKAKDLSAPSYFAASTENAVDIVAPPITLLAH